MRYLGDTQAAGGFDLPKAMQALAAKGGPGPVRQCLGLIRLLLNGSGVRPEEYYTYQLWRKDRGRAFLRDFLPNWRKQAFNRALRMPGRGPSDEVLRDKLAVEAILQARGLPVTRTLATFAPDGLGVPDGATGLRVLATAGDITAFLSDPATCPVFGKPRADSFARGAVVLSALEGPETLRFQDGRAVPVAALAQEIAQDWRTGYLFQPVYQAPDALRRHTGPAMASVRVVTLLTDRGVEPWYAVIRLPAPKAMHDGDAEGQRIWGLVDLGSGRILKLRDLRSPETPDLTHAADPDTAFLGMTLPDWPRALDLCVSGHDSFPGHGVIGWDVFLTTEGPLLNEANLSPGHLYQVAAQRPLLNPDMRPTYDRALAHARKHGAEGRPG
jgi:hypothetical protein